MNYNGKYASADVEALFKTIVESSKPASTASGKQAEQVVKNYAKATEKAAKKAAKDSRNVVNKVTKKATDLKGAQAGRIAKKLTKTGKKVVKKAIKDFKKDRLKAAYNKERKRIREQLRRAKAEGYDVDKLKIPAIPKRITQKSINRLKKLDAETLNKKLKKKVEVVILDKVSHNVLDKKQGSKEVTRYKAQLFERWGKDITREFELKTAPAPKVYYDKNIVKGSYGSGIYSEVLISSEESQESNTYYIVNVDNFDYGCKIDTCDDGSDISNQEVMENPGKWLLDYDTEVWKKNNYNGLEYDAVYDSDNDCFVYIGDDYYE